ncbi:unnamed protein product [Pelagomonas calceolata]|uniref:Uncharacterized protein n=1 Tax=Pelagomonas calceolata TaxID=35677 RepID=A0A8J2S5G1_9STRA|nr:unnamed protein product [Pelagomonas calceolata]
MASRWRHQITDAALYRYDSRPLRASMRSLTFLSSSAYSSASRTMRSMSSSDRRPFSAVIVIFSALPVPLSSALTCRIPFASISKVTSIWGTPRGAGGMPVSSNLPSLCENQPVSRVVASMA